MKLIQKYQTYKENIKHLIKCYNNPESKTEIGKRYYKELLNLKQEGKLFEHPSVKFRIKEANIILGNTIDKEKCLDVGCSFGSMLYMLKPYFSSVEGVEPKASTAKGGKEIFDVKIHKGYLEDFNFKNGSYDCIILSQVIEHLDSYEMFSKINKLLKPKGIVYISTPNADSLSMKLYKKRHTDIIEKDHKHIFSKKDFEILAEKYRFKIKMIRTDNNLNITFNGLVNWMFNRKKFIHRYNDIPGLNFINWISWAFIWRFFNTFKILQKCNLGCYWDVVLEKN